ncbi:MAG: hypothetical protein Q4B47_04680 [Eubacteriales bacterium]|nr:hypothetical protein [Eubacteriales bacterium]
MENIGTIIKEILPWLSVLFLIIVFLGLQLTQEKRPGKRYTSIGVIVGAVVGAGIYATHLVRLGICFPICVAIGLLVGAFIKAKE